MFKEQFKLAEITRFGCVSSTQNLCRKTILNVKAAIGLLVMSTNSCTCSTRDLFAHITHISMCGSNKPLICVEPTNGVCEYGPRSPTNFFLLGQLTLFNSVYKLYLLMFALNVHHVLLTYFSNQIFIIKINIGLTLICLLNAIT